MRRSDEIGLGVLNYVQAVFYNLRGLQFMILVEMLVLAGRIGVVKSSH